MRWRLVAINLNTFFVDSEIKMLPCERCGELILYDGIKEFGADTYCEFCGSESPHTLLGNPATPFFFLFLGTLVFALVNPFGMKEAQIFFMAFGQFCLLLWFKILRPIHIALLKADNPPGCAIFFYGCFSWGALGLGILSLLLLTASGR